MAALTLAQRLERMKKPKRPTKKRKLNALGRAYDNSVDYAKFRFLEALAEKDEQHKRTFSASWRFVTNLKKVPLWVRRKAFELLGYEFSTKHPKS